MADVFVSYKQEDRERVRVIVDALRSVRVDVWFDEGLAPGASFAEDIRRELHACRAQLVCWSKQAVGSEWVNGEAEIGRQRRTLIPVLLEPCAPNPPFNMLHAQDLSQFDGGDGGDGWRKVLAALGDKLERPGLPELWPLLSEGDDVKWKAWAEAFPLDPFVDEAWSRFEALRLDQERNRLAQERATARAAAEAAYARREAAAARAAEEAKRLEAAQARDRADAERARREALAAASAAPQPTGQGRIRLIVFGVLSAALVIGALSAALVMNKPGAEAAPAAATEAPLRAATPAALEAFELSGAWRTRDDERCETPDRLNVETDGQGEWLIVRRVVASTFAGVALTAEAARRERIVEADAAGVHTQPEAGAARIAYRRDAAGRLTVTPEGAAPAERLQACAGP